MRLLVVAGLCGLLLSIAIMGIATTHAATGHACASPVPPVQTTTPTIPTPTQGILLINEVLLNPASIWNCDSRSSNTSSENAWIEIYNPQNYAINLYAERAVIDSGPNTQTYALPFGSVIVAHGFFVVFPFLDANFAPGYFNNPQPLMLRLDLEYTPCDQITVPVLSSDLSYARTTDGGNKWETTSQPTIDSSNVLPLATAKPTAKAKATASTRKHKTKTKKQRTTKGTTAQAGGRGGSSNTGTPKNVINAKQPTWQQMHLPASDQQVSAANQTNATPQGVVSTNPEELSLAQKMILSFVAVVLTLSLFGGSLLFLRYKRPWLIRLKSM